MKKQLLSIERLSKIYPIDGKDLYLLMDDTINGVRYMSASNHMLQEGFLKGEIDSEN